MGKPTKLTPLPSQIDLVSHIAKRFGNRPAEPRHMNAIIQAANSILAEFEREAVRATPDMGLKKWLASDDTGLSSRFMAAVLSNPPFICDFNYPHDPDDFGRCYRLLQAVPELRENFARLHRRPAPWPQLAAAWPELEKLYVEELPTGQAPKLYARMREIIDAAR